MDWNKIMFKNSKKRKIDFINDTSYPVWLLGYFKTFQDSLKYVKL